MAYDSRLAQRIRRILDHQPHVTEREMFGGIAFLVQGNIACGVIGDELMVRVGPEQHQAALKKPHVRPFDMTGRPFKGWVWVGEPGLGSTEGLNTWVKRGVDFALTLPAKPDRAS